ncbi:acetaldehyde dehydrogenase (acetylating) [Mycobacterium sp. shizuoka-1]|uniref:acetaldehyde dehydrogenase (acetylating) n=1 Tax=Mycobacterium sp. shizuoka-1 TaxID=2039281 RepID=UPI000C063FE0|nr:acetaldehyde dehydrogenase (acetylating) [Mycobacterium sp. shizuoka-1]GAY13779.1 acetaldehyde dehydrogenase [Mycobacterium sp. shizuoka-1]
MATRLKAAIIGSGNIGTDLMIKLRRRSDVLDPVVMVGIDPASDGLARAAALDVAVTAGGVDGLLAMDVVDDLAVVFDATSAKAHAANDARLRPTGVRIVDLTPAALGPFVVPAVNLAGLSDRRNVNMVTCGGQATIPVVAALSRITEVHYAEIVASIASRSAGPGTRANIDEFTVTTARAIEEVGGAANGKAIIVLNPAEPAMIMRDTVTALVSAADEQQISDSVTAMVDTVSRYVPGYRLKQDVRITAVPRGDLRRRLAGSAHPTADLQHVTVFLEVEGAADYLPAYAGNLDIMTSAAVRVGERLALHSVALQEAVR